MPAEAVDYRTMWADLGLDLEKHDMLLGVLGQAYETLFLSQKSRPKGMDYFNFVMSEVHGLRVKELRDAQAAGRKVLGAFCVFAPEEIVTAVDGILVGLCTGADFATEEVEKRIPRNTCALIKSAFGFTLGRVCPYIETVDMVVGENTCDGKKKAYETLGTILPNLYVMDLPQVKSANGRSLLRAEYERFLHAVEDLAGVKVTADRLRKGIRAVNAKRQALHRLARVRAADPAPISGLDALLVNQVAFYDDTARLTSSVNALCDELAARAARGEGVFAKGTPRILVSGCPMAVPNWKLPWIVEGAGAVIVGEESCVGERGARNLVKEDGADVGALLDNIVDRYLQVDCAVFTPNPDRLAHVKEMRAAYRADGVIHYCLHFCQPYLMESYPVAANLEAAGIPTLRIETDYGQEDGEQLRTRVEAFLERLR